MQQNFDWVLQQLNVKNAFLQGDLELIWPSGLEA